jgi:hypothetical protein
MNLNRGHMYRKINKYFQCHQIRVLSLIKICQDLRLYYFLFRRKKLENKISILSDNIYCKHHTGFQEKRIVLPKIAANSIRNIDPDVDDF